MVNFRSRSFKTKPWQVSTAYKIQLHNIMFITTTGVRIRLPKLIRILASFKHF